jgi:phosphatidylserine/phosphatidylglycerophosphate/cardiolipin synthase-like enzyme
MRRVNVQNPYTQTIKVGVAIIAVFAGVAYFTRKEEPKPEATPATAGASAGTEVYFSPHGGCTEAIVKALAGAKESIYVQAYSFTSQPIADALVAAQKRGVKVSAILDDSNKTDKNTTEDVISTAGVRTLIDSKHAIAHNKVIVIDARTVITGSFNFSKAAEESNAENLLVLHDPDLARKYLANWTEHEAHSEAYVHR